MPRPLPPLTALCLLAAGLAACLQAPTPTASTAAPQATATTSPTRAAAPTPSPDPSPTPAPTAPPLTLSAVSYESDPLLPILTYHQFTRDVGVSGAVKVRLSDFRAELESLYAAGYSLVPFERWLAGDLRVSPGRRPLVLSLDDLFYNNQIGLLPDGSPDPGTGIGALWQFSQEHPDFGFSLLLFANMGDKLYANPDLPDWEMKLAQTIVWCIEHGAIPYNHTYSHVVLEEMEYQDIQRQMRNNDLYLEELLTLAGRTDLIPRLGNMLAIPYGRWPASPSGLRALKEYVSTNGTPMQALFDVDYVYRPAFVPAPYLPEFERFRIPRMVATQDGVRYLVDQRAGFPTARPCPIVLDEPGRQDDLEYLAGQVLAAVQAGSCPPGVVALENAVFRASPSAVEVLTMPAPTP